LRVGPVVLLVEDDSNALEGYRELLAQHGFLVAVAQNASDAMARYRECDPDVIVTDIALPDRDGFTLAADLRAESAGRDMPILAMTAYWSADVHERAGHVGITTVLAKPCQPQHLVAELRRALHKP
jgi:CheY-like chemotaxis protein